MNRTAVPLLVAASLLLSSCAALPTSTSDPSASPTDVAELTVGDCLEKFDSGDSDRTSVVACTQPHAFDVLGFAMWPGMDAAIAADDAKGVFDALTGEANSLGSDYFAWASATCAQLLRESTGVDSLAVGDKIGNDLGLLPGGSFYIDNSLANHGKFVLEKDHRTLCAVAWLDVDGAPANVTWPSGVDIRSVLTPSMPAVGHYCFTIDDDQVTETQVGCDEPHVGERTAQIDLAASLGATIVASLSANGGTDTDWATIDAFCATVNDAVVPGGIDPALWISWSNLVGAYGDDNFLISCQIRSATDALVSTDVFAAAG
jgi:hypothetical protein